MPADKYKVPVSMLSPAVDPERLGFDDTTAAESPNIIADSSDIRAG
jgi:hypothetical protein